MLTKTRTLIVTLIATASIAGMAAPATFAAGGRGCTIDYTDSHGGKTTISMQDGASITLGKTEVTCNDGKTSRKPASLVSPPPSVTPVVISKAAPVTLLG